MRRNFRTYYCYLDSAGADTNLQLYSLEQAAHHWNELVDDLGEHGAAGVARLKERLVFILNCFGLSLSQLLGQNWPSPTKDQLDKPGDLLGNILKNSSLDKTRRRHLNTTFKDFLTYYGAVRHFGINKDNTIYKKVDELDPAKLERFRKMTIEIWDTMIETLQQNKANQIEIRSICDAVEFKELPGTAAA